MIFTVTWLPDAINDLTTLWMSALDRKAVTSASHRIDQLLRVDAPLQGKELAGNRMLIVGPLTVAFRVSLEDRLVEIVQITRSISGDGHAG